MKTYEICLIERKITLHVIEANSEKEAREKYEKKEWQNTPEKDVVFDNQLIVEEV